MRAAEPEPRVPGWRAVWERMVAGMEIEALEGEARTIAETAALPTTVVTVLPGSHLPHLEHPDELALLLSRN